MELNMRKEQVLVVVVVALGAWMTYGYWNDTYRRRRPSQKPKDYEATTPLTPFLADPKNDPGLGGDIFLEPSETRPLPPADLPFPPVDPLPAVAPPMPIGQQAGAYPPLRLDIDVVKVAKAAAPAPAAPPANGGKVAGVQDPLSPAQLARRYDRLVMLAGNKYWGFFAGPDAQKYKLGNSAGPYPEKTLIKFRWINQKTGTQLELLNEPGNKVKQLELAKTLKNEVESRYQKVSWKPSGLTQQVKFLRWLIQQGRREAWVFTRAMQAVNKHILCTQHDVDAYRLKVRILRAQGNLEGEWRLYQELPEKLMESAFRYQGMGEVQALLGLWKLAEKNLRKAVEVGPANPRAHAALARFLLARGRPTQAVVEADLAARDRQRLEPEERLPLDRTVIRAHLAIGDTEGARRAAPTDLPVKLTDQLRFLNACTAYAEGNLEEARTEFEACVASGKVPDAAFGVAACQLRQGEVVAARDGFVAVADQNPRLRHLALAGKGLALEHIAGQQSAALEALSAAHEANPTHPYVLYLLGRERRRTGDLDGAVEVLKEALARRDDFQEALAELTLAYERIYHRDTDASALTHAVKYSDRLVASEAAALNGSHTQATPLFRELQGWLHFQAGDYRGAREAFEKGQEKSEFCKIGLAIVTYKQKRYEEARDILAELRTRLPLRHEKRVFAEKLEGLMDAHDNLEQIQVTFDGKRLPKSWHQDQAGQVRPIVENGVLRIEGQLRGSSSVVKAWRELPGTGRFVSLDLSFQSRGQTPRFVGMEINNRRRDRRGGGRQDFMARFGLNRDGVLFLQIVDGRNLDPEETEPVLFRDVVVHRDRMNHLRLEAVPQKGDQDAKTLFLRASWNGEKLYERKLRRLRRGSGRGGKLNLELKVEGKGRTKVDVAFDNFRLIQIRGDK